MNKLALLTVVLSLSGCTCNLLADPQERAAALPASADVALRATHDLLIVACQDKKTLLDFALPVVSTAIFVGLGRLDAAFYLPGAIAKSAKCQPIDFTVSGAGLDTDVFELESTPNPRVFKLHSKKEGTSVFRAQVTIGSEKIAVTSTFRALKADRLLFSPLCAPVPAGLTGLPGHIPAGGGVEFSHQLFQGQTRLAGYGYFGVGHPRLVFNDGVVGRVGAKVAAERGPFTVTSEVDPAFALELTAYDATDFDPPALTRVTPEQVFVGATTAVLPTVTIGGKVPCVSGFAHTVAIANPSVCRFKGRTDTSSLPVSGNVPLQLEALATGTCRVTLTAPNGTTSSAVEFPVFRAFETFAALPSAAVHPAVSITSFWLASPTELFIVGTKTDVSGHNDPVAFRRVGAAWSTVSPFLSVRSLLALHGSRTDNALFAGGYKGEVASWDGMKWQAQDSGTPHRLNAIWVNSKSDVYAAGEGGAFIHFDGTGWSSIDAGTTGSLRGLWGDGAGQIYLVGGSGTAVRWNGSSFSDVLPAELQDGGTYPRWVSGSRPDDLWVGTFRQSHHFNGSGWTSYSHGPETTDVVSGLWAVGDGYSYALARRSSAAFVDRFDGTRTVSIPIPGTARAISGLGNQVFVLTGTEVLVYRHDPADVFP